MTTRSFNFIVGLLKESQAFNYWKNHQLKSPSYISVEKQTCIFLYFLSKNIFYSDLADYFGVAGSGAISQILDRVAKGLLEYKSVYINGHADASKRQMLLDANSRGFTHYKITGFDKEFPHSWTTRKSIYGMVSMVICDIRDKIFWYSTGIPGFRNDRGILKSDVLPNISHLTDSTLVFI